MRILITGAAGFIGFHLAQKLAQKPYSHFVLGLDNFNSYYDPALKQQRTKLLQNLQTKTGKIEIVQGDIRNRALLEKLLSEYRISHLVHLAAQAGVRRSFSHPGEYLSNNIEGFLNVLEALKNFPRIKTVYASSSSVYGLNEKVPFSTGDATDKPANFYGASKKAGELMAHAYRHLYGLDLIGLRFFTVYGPWGRPDMAYFKFTENIYQGKPIKLFNNGNMQRDFTYIDDITDGIIAALNTPLKFGLFNLGNNRPLPILKLVEIIEKYLNKKAVLKYLPRPKGEVLTTYADISQSQKLLDFQPKTSLKTGMQKFLDWYFLWHQKDRSLNTSASSSIRSEARRE